MCFGAAAGMAVCLVLVLLSATGVDVRAGASEWLAAIPIAVLALLGGAAGVSLGRVQGTDVDDSGLHPVPDQVGGYVAWRRVDDLYTERRGGRTRIVVQLDNGQVARLRAPYDGRWFAHDPAFERKMFMLRHLWATHRGYAVSAHHYPPRRGTGPRGQGRVVLWPGRLRRSSWRSRGIPSG